MFTLILFHFPNGMDSVGSAHPRLSGMKSNTFSYTCTDPLGTKNNYTTSVKIQTTPSARLYCVGTSVFVRESCWHISVRSFAFERFSPANKIVIIQLCLDYFLYFISFYYKVQELKLLKFLPRLYQMFNLENYHFEPEYDVGKMKF